MCCLAENTVQMNALFISHAFVRFLSSFYAKLNIKFYKFFCGVIYGKNNNLA
jgi:hypothetical protein